ncbi:lipoprotein insertase outer membrane protein LolB [Pseudomonadota bacterium]
MPNSFRYAALFVWLLLVSACATRPTVSPSAAESVWLAHQASVQNLSNWQVQGRVAVSREQEGWNANFDWQQSGEDYRIRLRGPFGQGAVELHGNNAGVWLKRKDQPALYAHDAEALLEAETGWHLPLNGFGSWLRGLPEAAAPATLDWDTEGRLRSLLQADWEIDYRRYQVVNDLSLPDRLRLNRDSLLVKVVIDQWEIQ